MMIRLDERKILVTLACSSFDLLYFKSSSRPTWFFYISFMQHSLYTFRFVGLLCVIKFFYIGLCTITLECEGLYLCDLAVLPTPIGYRILLQS